LKILGKNVILFFFFGNFDAYCTKEFLPRHKVHYKIIPSCNTWHTWAVSGVIKYLEPLKTLSYYSVCKIHILATLFSYLTPLTRRIEKWKYGNSRETGEKILCSIHQSQALPLHCPFYGCIITKIQSAFSFLWVHSKFKYRSFISSYSGNETSFGLNWKAAKVQDMWRAVHSRVLWGIPCKGVIQLNDRGGGEAYIHRTYCHSTQSLMHWHEQYRM
jgi:hypothetical protein